MTQSLFFAVAGVLFGLANVIPGVSGGTMAVVFGIYERLIGILSDQCSRFCFMGHRFRQGKWVNLRI